MQDERMTFYILDFSASLDLKPKPQYPPAILIEIFIMPTEKLFAAVPPFPEDIPIARLSILSLERLLAHDVKESAQLFESCKSDGFFLLDLRCNSIGEILIETVEILFEVNKALFEEGPEELKKFTHPPPGVLGYNAFGATKVESGLPDRFEWYVMSQDDIMGQKFITTSNSVVSHLLSLLDQHLGLPDGTLESRQRIDKESGTIVRMLKYPPQPEGDRRTSLFGHTDLGTITLLFNVVGGLQILPAGSEGLEENWRYVKPMPGCVIVNLGDMTREWTGGILRSNPHRVTFPPGEQATVTRYSLAYLMRAEAQASMKRLALEGSLIKPLGDGEKDIEVGVDKWIEEKTALARLGKDPASNRNGLAVQAY
ncbi:oxidoreductase [Mollisia scopiformis]|uniref:Oxidoreductase n=1 Tax=Mollisia scopiformis TaxID=149040 RepID=A0A132BCG3_MOLSC|nr:oxidoreductase [Mollisia scopiformis]KUJ10120.1 oxidoreductase [Mollisia scopiformis]